MEFPAKIRYTVDFSQASHYADFYNAIRKGLDLPDYVGKNTDALWDCLKGFIEWPCEITITGLSSLSQGLLREVQNVLTVFKQAEKAYPQDIRVIMEDEKSFCENYEYTIAQTRAIGFYERLGYAVCGEEHMDGHVPHKMMNKRL